MHQQKQNVISIGKYFKVFQPFKMKQNLSLQTVSSSHCSSSTCLFQGKQIHFDLKWLKLIPAQNQPFPTTHSELGEDLVVIKNLLTVFIPASPNKVSSMFCMTDVTAFHPVLGDAWVMFSTCSLRWSQSCQQQGMASLHLNFGLLAAKYQCWSEPHGKRHHANVFCVGM